MKRVLSLLLMLSLLIGSIPLSYADTETAGQKLQKLGLVSGYGNGQLGENDNLTRAQMMVLIAQLKGVDNQAKYYALPSKSVDVDPFAWYAPYVAYAEAQAWTSGIGPKRFGPNQMLTSQEAVTFMLKVLGYTVPDYSKVMEQAENLKITTGVFGTGTKAITRGEVFTYMYNTLNTPMANSTVTLGVNLGVLKPEKPPVATAPYKVDRVEPLANKLVEVKLKEAATGADASQFKIADSQGTTLNIEKADLIDSKTLWLTTAEQKPAMLYTLMADVSIKFAGIGKDTTQPVINKAASKVVDNVTYKLVFDKELDPRTALVTGNYSVDNGMAVLGAKFDVDNSGKELRNEVLLSTSSQKSGTLYKLTVSKLVTDLAGNSVKQSDDLGFVLFGGLVADTTAPRVTTAIGLNGLKAVVYFDDESGLDKVSAENIGNYTVVNKTNSSKPLNVVSATLIKDANGKYNHVELRTTQMELGNIYEVAVTNVSDKFGNVISATTNYKTTFAGQPLDTQGPRIVSAEPVTNTKFKINFNETLNKVSAESYGNYTLSNGLAVLSASLDESDNKVVYITTSTQTMGIAYVVTVSNVMDEYGNVVSSSYNKAYVAGTGIDQIAPRVVSAVATVESGGTYVTVKFNEAVNETSAKTGSNYYFGPTLGYGFSVTKEASDTYKVRTNSQVEATIYTVSVSNVDDLSGNGIDSTYRTASFVGKAVADSEPVKLSGVASADRQTMTVIFSKAMAASKTGEAVTANGTVSDRDAADPDNYKLFYNGTLVGSPTKAYVNKEKTMVTVRFATPVLESGKVYVMKVNASTATDDFDDATTSLYDVNNMAITSTNANVTFGGVGNELAKPRLVTAYALNSEVIYMKFSAPVMKDAAFADGSISFSASGRTTRTAVAAYTAPLSTDPTILAVKVNGTLDSNVLYTITVANANHIKDIYNDQGMDTSYSLNANFYSSSNANDAPAISKITSVDATSIIVSFSKELDAADKGDYRITTNGGEITPSFAEFVNGNENEVKLYFDNSNMTTGSVYKLMVPALMVADKFGKQNSSELSDYFAVMGGSRANVSISNAYALSKDTIRLVFSRPIADVNSVLNGSDFTITNTPVGGVWTVDKAYGQGSLVTLSGTDVPQNTFVDIIDLKCSKLLSKDVMFTVTFNAGTVSNYKAKDGAGLDGTPTKSFNGILDLTSYRLTAGVAATDSVTADSINITVTDNSLSLTNVKNSYAKVGYVTALASGNPYDTQTQLVTAINGFNMAGAVNKGTTPMTLSAGATGTFDVLVMFFDSTNNFIGYSLVENVVVTN